MLLLNIEIIPNTYYLTCPYHKQGGPNNLEASPQKLNMNSTIKRHKKFIKNNLYLNYK
jgi:hypothetical protein